MPRAAANVVKKVKDSKWKSGAKAKVRLKAVTKEAKVTCLKKVKNKKQAEADTQRMYRMTLVTRLLKPGSPEAQTPEAKAAKLDEVQKHIKNQTMRFGHPVEWSKVKREDPRATVMRLNFILSSKHDESPAKRKLKARAVLQGNLQRDGQGTIMQLDESGMVSDPLTFAELRSVVMAGLLQPDGWVEQADAEAAYLTAPMQGDAIYARVPPEFRTGDERAWQNMADPVLRVDRAVYGAERSGFDYQTFRTRQLKKIGFELTGESLSVYQRKVKPLKAKEKKEDKKDKESKATKSEGDGGSGVL